VLASGRTRTLTITLPLPSPLEDRLSDMEAGRDASAFCDASPESSYVVADVEYESWAEELRL